MFYCFYSLLALAKRETIERSSFAFSSAYSAPARKERGRCREQGIRKIGKCLQTRLSTRAEHRRPMWGEITFTLTYLLQLRLCFGELPYQLRIRFVPGSVPFEESQKHPCVQEMFFSHGNKQGILS